MWSTCVGVCQLSSENLISECFSKHFEESDISLKSDKNNGYFSLWRPLYFYDSNLLTTS